MRKYGVAAVLFFVLSAGAVNFMPYGLAQDEKDKGDLQLSGTVEDGVRVINVVASRYKFDPDPIVVKLGERVRIVATTADDTHGFGLAAFDVNMIIRPDNGQSTEFVADKIGEFDVVCTFYCGSGHAGMRAKFIVVK